MKKNEKASRKKTPARTNTNGLSLPGRFAGHPTLHLILDANVLDTSGDDMGALMMTISTDGVQCRTSANSFRRTGCPSRKSIQGSPSEGTSDQCAQGWVTNKPCRMRTQPRKGVMYMRRT